MKKIFVLLLILAFIASISYGAIGDVYDLGDAIWNSVDPLDPYFGSTNPYTDPNGGVWSFVDGSDTLFPTGITYPSSEANSELPSTGRGWTLDPGSHISLSIFDVNDGSNTNYEVGDIGGHGPIAAIYETLSGGTFVIETSGYNARINKGTSELALQLKINDTELYYLVFSPVQYPDSNDSLVPASVVAKLNANDTVRTRIDGQDWGGMTFTLTEISSADVPLTISTNLPQVDTVDPYSNDTQYHSVDSVISIDAYQYADCSANGGQGEVLAFSHWEVVSGNVQIHGQSVAASTTLSFSGEGGGEIRANYVDVSACGDVCHPILDQDLDPDCVINLRDFAAFASYWLQDTSPQ